MTSRMAVPRRRPSARTLPVVAGWLLLSTAVRAELVFEGAWVRALPPIQTATAAYGTVRNTGSDAVRIETATSPIAQQATLHNTVTEGGTVRMTALDGITLAPGETFAFTPGGPHIMLMGLEAAPAEGSQVELCLSGDGESVCVRAPVRRDGPDHSHHH